MRTKLFTGIFLALCVGGIKPAAANNIQVSNTTLTGNTGSEVMVQFDISWENSWRGGGVANWDAAWVFVKFKYSNGLWRHVQLATSGHVPAGGSLIDQGLLTPGAAADPVTNPTIGVFIRRDADGTGTFSATGVQLKWDYVAQGILTYNDITEVRVFAIEMVYVNQGPFAAGSGGTETNAFTLTTIFTATANTPGNGNGPGTLGGEAGGHPTGTQAPVATYPNGYNAYYCGKYEISQQQYVDFLNTLTRPQQNARTATDLSDGITSVTNVYVMSNGIGVFNRNGIRCDAIIDATATLQFSCDGNGNGTGGEASDGQCLACNYLGWSDILAYLDWSGLRPMSELEFEKACRGPLPPTPNEYAWGMATINTGAMTLGNVGAADESVLTGYSSSAGNASGASGSLTRVGIFAANPSNSNRMTAGAGYYGAMDLSGNVYERIQSLDGSYYSGLHGNGALTTLGEADVNSWIGNLDACGSRGGAFSVPIANITYLRVSDRFAAVGGNPNRLPSTGGRGVRTAP
ncbi:MAG: SUMF1/EgtB/PvdO family nonheme iron enzyme [Flavobacteriales bacterium]|nr:SUMF1/EgtB/PvdO family nonheme iron enzyme [Flavobacteriales bacterium]